MSNSIRDSLLVASMPVLSFMGAYLFEVGYADVFGYDHYFIELNIKSIVLGLVCVVAIFWPCVLLILGMVHVIKDHGRVGRAVALPFLFPAGGMIGLVMTGLQSKFMIAFTVVTAFFAIAQLAWVYFKYKFIGVSEAFENFAKSQGISTFVGPPAPSTKPKVFDKLIAYFMMTVLLVLAGILIRGAGVGVAHLKTSYTIVELESQEYALVAVYGDAMILAGITAESHNKEIVVKSRSSSKPFKLRTAYLPNFTSKNTLYFY